MFQSLSPQWVLRVAIAGEFLGHGVFGLQQKAGWIKYFTAVGISSDTALTLLPLIGLMDVAIALIILVKPLKGIVLWAVAWGFVTALMRPIAGEPIWDFVERWANWGAPLALLLMMGAPRSWKELFRS